MRAQKTMKGANGPKDCRDDMDPEILRLVQEQLGQIRALRERLDSVEEYCAAIAKRLGADDQAPAEPLQSQEASVPADTLAEKAFLGETSDLTDAGMRYVDKGTCNLKDALVAVLSHAGKPLSFEDIFAAIQHESPELLPDEKPKLHVRRLLYRRDIFTLRHGFFLLRSASATGSNSVANPKTTSLNSRERPPDETLILDTNALLAKRSAVEKDETAPSSASASAEEAPASPPSRGRLPRQDHFTSRLESILGTDTRFRVPPKESEPSAQE